MLDAIKCFTEHVYKLTRLTVQNKNYHKKAKFVSSITHSHTLYVYAL